MDLGLWRPPSLHLPICQVRAVTTVHVSVAAACGGDDFDMFHVTALGTGESATESCGRVQRCVYLRISQGKALLGRALSGPRCCVVGSWRRGMEHEGFAAAAVKFMSETSRPAAESTHPSRS